MTLSMVPAARDTHSTRVPSGSTPRAIPGVPGVPGVSGAPVAPGAPGAPGDEDHRAWALVEIRHDGSVGRAELVTPETAATVTRLPQGRRHHTPRPPADAAALDLRLGLLQASHGQLRAAARCFEDGIAGSRRAGTPSDCRGALALVEAFAGELTRAQHHAELALATTTTGEGAEGVGVHHARLAQAWVLHERGETGESARLLALANAAAHHTHPSPWTAAASLLLEARLLLASGRPEAAVRLLAAGVDDPGVHTPWTAGLLTTARADALLAAGEPRRALGALTPPPREVLVEAAVVAAAVRHAVGDLRGAESVLAGVVDSLDTARWEVQLRAWLLEARLCEDKGDPERARALVARTLRAAAVEDLRSPVVREWPWLRGLVEGEPTLVREHRSFLAGVREAQPRRPGHHRLPGRGRDVPEDFVLTSLTERESDVLELLAQMCSTDEMASILFVSVNTVRTHVRSILAKLCVNRRTDAVRRGRQLGLC